MRSAHASSGWKYRKRFTCRDAREAFLDLCRRRDWLPGMTRGHEHDECEYIGPGHPWWRDCYFLEEYSPGDGMTRYRVMRGSGNSGEQYGPFGASYWLGAREAVMAMERA